MRTAWEESVIRESIQMQVECFSDLALSKDILRGIKELGFENPSPIQAQSIGPLLEGKDVVGQAQTGTGKTAAFGIPMIERMVPESRLVQGLVLAPTRELAVQISDHLSRIGKYAGVKVLPIYGGDSMERQVRALRGGIHIVVGTPGRILDHLAQRTLSLASVKVVVLDEADRMLDMGFIADIKRILAVTPRDKQMSLFSATLDQSVMDVCDTYLRKPEKILVSKDEITLSQITQFYVSVEPEDKFDVLCSILGEHHVERAIVFCKTQRNATKVATLLKDKAFDAKPLHGGLTQPQRDTVMAQFRKGKLKVLVATDIAGRGIDVEEITHIINFNVPADPLAYFHRIGRTARMEAEGTSITFVGGAEAADFRQIRAMTKTKITELRGNHDAIIAAPKAPKPRCADCGKECSVPFKPTNGRPVYCTSCYTKHRPARNPVSRFKNTSRSSSKRYND